MTEVLLNYRRKAVGAKGHKVYVRLLPEGKGFMFDIEDSKNRLIRRDLTEYETPGEAERAASAWIEYNQEDL